jgi:hypothetical protein
LFAALQHGRYIQAMNLDQSSKESGMFLKNFLVRVTGLQFRKPAEMMSYDDIFEGEASGPAATAVGSSHFLPGLRPVKDDVDLYFKEVFSGPAF